jgi:hypothetical protein
MLNLPPLPSHRPKHITFRKRKDLALFLVLGILVVLAGSLLVRSLLKNHYNFSTTQSPPVSAAFSPSVLYWEAEIQTWADTWRLDPLLIATVMQIESCGNPNIASPAGAQGLFQVMPFHFDPDENMLDPQTNAGRGMAYLSRSYILAEGDIALALAGYNGGHGQIAREVELWPDETQRYVLWGTGIYQDAKDGVQDAPSLTAWLNAGGQNLCDQAEIELGLTD